ncbi:MAG: hypothetical protein NT136_03665 [Candidatus Moranbacteria bacterium]|nr:hypothetical protein [Candidatus Moranbacteria bacterium]
MESFILRTQERGKFPVTNLHSEGTVIVSLPHRHSFWLNRFENILTLECDLGHMPGDQVNICKIDLSEKDYEKAMEMAPEFLSWARSFENSFQVNRFVDAYAVNNYQWASALMFGLDHQDQMWINLSPDWRKKTNIEFSIIKDDYIDFLGDKHKLDEPAMTLACSLKLYGQKPYYFLFVEWWGDNSWRYGKNFFYNNTAFAR